MARDRLLGNNPKGNALSDDIDQPTFLGGLRRGEMAADHFTILSNHVLRDQTISFRAKGVFGNMASHRQDFTITEEFLASMGTEGVKAIRAALHELRQAGYVYRGARMRYPHGSVNAKGKDISGALGAFEWYVTDKPEEVAAILERYAAEQRDQLDITPSHDNMPQGKLVLTSKNNDLSTTNPEPSLGAETADSIDQEKSHNTPGKNKLPKPPVGCRSTREDYPQKTSHPENQPLPPSLRSGGSLWVTRPSVCYPGDVCADETDGSTHAGTEPNGTDRDRATAIVGEVDLSAIDARRSQVTQIREAVATALTAGYPHEAVLGYLQRKVREAKTVRYVLGAFAADRLSDIAYTPPNRPRSRPACAHCGAREGEPKAVRTVDTADGRARRCPQCHPNAAMATESS